MVTKLLLIGAGGFIGSIFRYAVGGAVQSLSQSVAFPFGTLAVNILGCFCIGVLSELFDTRAFINADTRAFLIIGILGGFTTFSAFGNETMNLIRDGDATGADQCWCASIAGAWSSLARLHNSLCNLEINHASDRRLFTPNLCRRERQV